MSRIRICFEVSGIAKDVDGFPVPTGMQIDFGEIGKEVDYAELTQNLNISGILEYMHLDNIISPDAVTIITPEEYDERYSDNDFEF